MITVALIGSSMLKPGARSPKPCQRSFAFSIQSSRLPMPSSAQIFGSPYLEPPESPYSSSILRIARRKSSASKIDSSTSALPPGGSIIAAATSHEAMMAYCGDVDVCIRYASLKLCRSSLRARCPARGSARPAKAGEHFVRRLRREDNRFLQRGRFGRSHACPGKSRETWHAAAMPRRSAECRPCRRASA